MSGDDNTCERVHAIIMYGADSTYQIDIMNDHILYCSQCEDLSERLNLAKKTLGADSLVSYIELCEKNLKKRNNKKTMSISSNKDTSLISSSSVELKYVKEEVCSCGTMVERQYWSDSTNSVFPITPQHTSMFGTICCGDFSDKPPVLLPIKKHVEPSIPDKLEITKREY